MKHTIKTFAITLLFSMFSFISFAQSENDVEMSKPTTDIEIERFVRGIDIEGEIYENVIVNIKSFSPDDIHSKYRVKIIIKDENNKKIYDKTFNNTFLYIFSNGQIQIGIPKFDKMIIYRSIYTNDYWGIIREKEGIYF